MFCDNCGCKLEEGVTICPVCGRNTGAVAGAGNQRNQAVFHPADAVGTSLDMGRVLPDISRKENTPVINTDDMEEEGTAVLRADEPDLDDGETTVLSGGANGMPQMGPMQRMPQGNAGMNRNGMGPMQRMPQGNRMQQMQGGIPQFQSRPGVGQPGAAAQPEKRKNEKKAKKEKPPKQPKPQKNPSGKKKGKGALVAVLVILIVLVLAAGGGAAYFVPKYLNYSKAQEAYEEGKIEDAISLYGKAGTFKNAEAMANGGAYYEYAASLAEAENYTEAASYYEKTAALTTLNEAYGDAAEKAKECYFNQGETLFAAARYTEASEYYTKAGDLDGAADKIKECAYMNGLSLAEQKQYDDAITQFTAAGDFSDSADKIKECYYNKAVDLMAAGDYTAAKELFLQSEYSDYADLANECLLQIADQYETDGDYENAIATYEQVDSDYTDCTEKIDKAYKKWGNALYKSKDYVAAIDAYSHVTTSDMTKKIKKAKAAYIKDHFDKSNETTMTYVCELKYAGYGTSEDDYTSLTGWTVESFVNDGQEDYDSKGNTGDSSNTIYIHTMFSCESDTSMTVKGYVVYSDGTQSNEVTFGEVKDSYTTWMSIAPESAIKGAATLYIYDTDTGYLIEKYSFTIK